MISMFAVTILRRKKKKMMQESSRDEEDDWWLLWIWFGWKLWMVSRNVNLTWRKNHAMIEHKNFKVMSCTFFWRMTPLNQHCKWLKYLVPITEHRKTFIYKCWEYLKCKKMASKALESVWPLAFYFLPVMKKRRIVSGAEKWV